MYFANENTPDEAHPPSSCSYNIQGVYNRNPQEFLKMNLFIPRASQRESGDAGRANLYLL